uniref:basic proline-rich protein-like n=1 Tax=Nyctereutes procyonoides TaxID=34880 RepID=UPI002443DA09|nr:basic proline-rich protein-like [Nyctereutes procyonoides]
MSWYIMYTLQRLSGSKDGKKREHEAELYLLYLKVRHRHRLSHQMPQEPRPSVSSDCLGARLGAVSPPGSPGTGPSAAQRSDAWQARSHGAHTPGGSPARVGPGARGPAAHRPGPPGAPPGPGEAGGRVRPWLRPCASHTVRIGVPPSTPVLCPSPPTSCAPDAHPPSSPVLCPSPPSSSSAVPQPPLPCPRPPLLCPSRPPSQLPCAAPQPPSAPAAHQHPPDWPTCCVLLSPDLPPGLARELPVFCPRWRISPLFGAQTSSGVFPRTRPEGAGAPGWRAAAPGPHRHPLCTASVGPSPHSRGPWACGRRLSSLVSGTLPPRDPQDPASASQGRPSTPENHLRPLDPAAANLHPPPPRGLSPPGSLDAAAPPAPAGA